MSLTRETTLTLFIISLEAEIVLIFVCSITLIPLDLFWYSLVGMKRRTVGVLLARETTITVFLM